jgi:chemotaxis protein MotB
LSDFQREKSLIHGPGLDYHKIENSHGGGHDEEEGEGPWLMSFADMVTLLMCFFILFFQTEEGNIRLQNPEQLMQKLEALQKVLGIEEETLVKQLQMQKTPSGSPGSVDSFRKDMQEMSKDLNLVFSVGTPHPGEIELTFLNSRFFRSGRADLTPEAEKMLGGVAKKLLAMREVSEIEVEGHTDSDPIRSARFPSNWELSSARSSTVVKFLSGRGVDPAILKASGLAHYKPIAPEKDAKGRSIEANKSINRRIVVRIKSDGSAESGDAPPPDKEETKPPKPERKSKRKARDKGT